MIVDLHHVSINVTDAARSTTFYTEVLGLAELPRPAFPFGGAWLDTGVGRQIHLIETDRVPGDVGQHLALAVDDIDAAIATVRHRGVSVPDAKPIPGTAIRQTFLHDPDGNRIELTQPA